ncbi:MAG: hypothetical protein AB1349_03805 [Elusimicrobiota bacterium]
MKIIRNKYFITFVVGIFATAGGNLVSTYIFDFNFIKSLLNFIVTLVVYIYLFFTQKFTLPLWKTILFFDFFPLLIFIIFVGIMLFKNKKSEKLDWYNYTKDVFYKVCWHWKYIDNKICNLTPHCPKCDCELNQGYTYECPNPDCKYRNSDLEDEGNIEKLIIHKIQTGKYKTKNTGDGGN